MGYEMTLFPLGPVFALQGRYVRRVTPRLPEAPGPRAGTHGAGSELRLLLLGDSAAAGVGAPSQDEALCGRLTSELAQSFRVSWALVARSGATTAGTTRHLVRSTAALRRRRGVSWRQRRDGAAASRSVARRRGRTRRSLAHAFRGAPSSVLRHAADARLSRPPATTAVVSRRQSAPVRPGTGTVGERPA
jgi:hypothetical protein